MAIRTPYTPLFGDVLDYLNRGSTIRGLPSIAGIFDDYDASKNNRLGIFEEEEETTKPIVPVGIPAAPMNQMRDGNEGQRGIGSFGKFGNLDKNDVRYFQDENGNLVKGYRNITSGLYQTEDGKNVQGILDEYEYTPTSGLGEQEKNLFSGYQTTHPFSEGYRGIALKAAEDTRLEQKLAEERLQREKEKAALQKRLAEEKAVADRAREKNRSVYESADRQGFTNDQGGFSTSRADKAGTSEGSGQFSPSSSRGRSGY